MNTFLIRRTFRQFSSFRSAMQATFLTTKGVSMNGFIFAKKGFVAWSKFNITSYKWYHHLYNQYILYKNHSKVFAILKSAVSKQPTNYFWYKKHLMLRMLKNMDRFCKWKIYKMMSHEWRHLLKMIFLLQTRKMSMSVAFWRLKWFSEPVSSEKCYLLPSCSSICCANISHKT